MKAECPVQIWKFQNPLLSLLPSVRIEELSQKEAKAANGDLVSMEDLRFMKAECPAQIWKFQNPLLTLLPSVRNEEVLQKEAKAAKEGGILCDFCALCGYSIVFTEENLSSYDF